MRYATNIGVFEIDSLPSQVQVAVCHGFFVFEHQRGKGLATELHKQQISKLIELGYDFAMSTVAADNIKQISAIKKAGWKKSDEFYNGRICTNSLLFTFNVREYSIAMLTAELAGEFAE